MQDIKQGDCIMNIIKKTTAFIVLLMVFVISACNNTNAVFSNPDKAYDSYKRGVNLAGLTVAVKAQEMTYSDDSENLEAYNNSLAALYIDPADKDDNKMIYRSSSSTKEVCIFVNSDATVKSNSKQVVKITKAYEKNNNLYIFGYFTEDK